LDTNVEIHLKLRLMNSSMISSPPA